MVSPHIATRRLKDTIDYLIDAEVGIINRLNEDPHEPGEPNFFHFWANAANTAAFSQQENFSKAGGSSINRDAAMGKAIGEAIERYCAAIYDKYEFPLCTYNDAKFTCIHPKEFSLYSTEQHDTPGFLYNPFTENTPIRWVPAEDPLTSNIFHVPASMVFVPYYYDRGEESPICQPISTGLACHSSYFDAAINAICEVIERDAFLITWQAMLSRPQIIQKTLSSENIEIITRFEDVGYSISLFHISLDLHIPTILSVMRTDNSESPALVVAASTTLDPEIAVKKSLEELAHTANYSSYILHNQPRLSQDKKYENVVDQKSHLNFWVDKKNLPLANFLFESDQQINFKDIENFSSGNPEDDFHFILKKIKASGYQTLLCDLTSEDVMDLGFRVIRAIIPGFHPLFVGHIYRALESNRLWTIPQKLGYVGIKNGRDNPIPHPYP